MNLYIGRVTKDCEQHNNLDIKTILKPGVRETYFSYSRVAVILSVGAHETKTGRPMLSTWLEMKERVKAHFYDTYWITYGHRKISNITAQYVTKSTATDLQKGRIRVSSWKLRIGPEVGGKHLSD